MQAGHRARAGGETCAERTGRQDRDTHQIQNDKPALGPVLRPEIAALSMSGSSFLVAVDALLRKRLRLPTPAGGDTSTGQPTPPRPVPAAP